MKLLSRAEEIILLVVFKLGNEAYGISIRDHIHEATGKEWSFAMIYDPLNKLTRKGLLKKQRGEPTSERGGRHKYFYAITQSGEEVLKDIYTVHKNLWEGVRFEILR